MHVSLQKSFGRQQDLLSVRLLPHLVFKCLLELFELHVVALFFQVGDDAIQVDILAHTRDETLVPRVQEATEVFFLFSHLLSIRVRVETVRDEIVDLLLNRENAL